MAGPIVAKGRSHAISAAANRPVGMPAILGTISVVEMPSADTTSAKLDEYANADKCRKSCSKRLTVEWKVLGLEAYLNKIMGWVVQGSSSGSF